MSELKDQLIKIGHETPALRPHLSVILDALTFTASSQTGSVHSAGSHKIIVDTPEVYLDVTPDYFSIRSRDAEQANPIIIYPHSSKYKTSIKKMYKWVSENEQRIKRMTFLEIRRELDELGIPYNQRFDNF
jgi:hypothetical protein